MATYIRNEIAQYSEITMKMNFNKFSDRQIKNILKQIKNGAVSYGHSATATVAKWLLGKYPMPHFRYDSYYIKWQDLPNGHPFFSKLKDAAALSKWLPPNGFTCTVDHIDAVVGGTFRMSFTNFASGGSHSFGGKYLELIPYELIRYTDAFDDPNFAGEIQVTIKLKKVLCGTELTIEQAGIPEVIPSRKTEWMGIDKCFVILYTFGSAVGRFKTIG